MTPWSGSTLGAAKCVVKSISLFVGHNEIDSAGNHQDPVSFEHRGKSSRVIMVTVEARW